MKLQELRDQYEEYKEGVLHNHREEIFEMAYDIAIVQLTCDHLENYFINEETGEEDYEMELPMNDHLLVAKEKVMHMMNKYECSIQSALMSEYDFSNQEDEELDIGEDYYGRNE